MKKKFEYRDKMTSSEYIHAFVEMLTPESAPLTICTSYST